MDIKMRVPKYTHFPRFYSILTLGTRKVFKFHYYQMLNSLPPQVW